MNSATAPKPVDPDVHVVEYPFIGLLLECSAAIDLIEQSPGKMPLENGRTRAINPSMP